MMSYCHLKIIKQRILGYVQLLGFCHVAWQPLAKQPKTRAIVLLANGFARVGNGDSVGNANISLADQILSTS